MIVDCTYEHSTTSGTPLSPFKHASANSAPAYLWQDSINQRRSKINDEKGQQNNTYAIDNVAEPFPAFASTTSVPPSWVRLVRAVSTSPDKLAWGVAYIVYKIEYDLAQQS